MKLSKAFIYSFNYDIHYTALCKLESRQLFGEEVENKLLFSDIKIDPSISPFIRSRFEIISSFQNYFDLLKAIEKQDIRIEGFKVEYLVLEGDATTYSERLQKIKGIGHSIEGEPDYEKPSIIFSLCNYKNIWYFGRLIKHDPDWQKHKDKPCSFSNSINMDIAKILVSISSRGYKSNLLLDACCGVGTVMLEACFSNFIIEGCDINWKACKHTRQNLSHFNYVANVFCMDIKELNKKYDAAIIDLPYNLYSYSDDETTATIIASTSKLAHRIVIVSITDIEDVINESGFIVSDYCTVVKKGKSNFERKIWVCERSEIG